MTTVRDDAGARYFPSPARRWRAGLLLRHPHSDIPMRSLAALLLALAVVRRRRPGPGRPDHGLRDRGFRPPRSRHHRRPLRSRQLPHHARDVARHDAHGGDADDALRVAGGRLAPRRGPHPPRHEGEPAPDEDPPPPRDVQLRPARAHPSVRRAALRLGAGHADDPPPHRRRRAAAARRAPRLPHRLAQRHGTRHPRRLPANDAPLRRAEDDQGVRPPVVPRRAHDVRHGGQFLRPPRRPLDAALRLPGAGERSADRRRRPHARLRPLGVPRGQRDRARRSSSSRPRATSRGT